MWSCLSWAVVDAVNGGEHCPSLGSCDVPLIPPVGSPATLVILTGRPELRRLSFLTGSASNVSPIAAMQKSSDQR